MRNRMDSEDFGRGLAILLKEYAGKLHEMLADVRNARRPMNLPHTTQTGWVGTAEWEAFQSQLNRIHPALLNATREASQLAELGDVDDLTRLKLRIRLAEVEGLLEAVTILSHQH